MHRSIRVHIVVLCIILLLLSVHCVKSMLTCQPPLFSRSPLVILTCSPTVRGLHAVFKQCWLVLVDIHGIGIQHGKKYGALVQTCTIWKVSTLDISALLATVFQTCTDLSLLYRAASLFFMVYYVNVDAIYRRRLTHY